MNIKFFAYIRDITKCKEVDVEDFGTVRELLNYLCSRYGRELELRIFDGNKLSNEIIILVNGRHISHLDGLETGLKDSDEVSIFPVVAGG